MYSINHARKSTDGPKRSKVSLRKLQPLQFENYILLHCCVDLNVKPFCTTCSSLTRKLSVSFFKFFLLLSKDIRCEAFL